MQQSPAIARLARFSHFVTPANAGLLRDLSSAPVTSVSAASFEPGAVAPESIVTAFGTQLATQTAIASDANPNIPGVQLPTQLANTTVEVNRRRAGLFFVSPAQVNYLMPPETETGTANVVIKSGDGTTSNGTVEIALLAPGIFSANADGSGVPAAVLLRVKTDGRQFFESLSQYNAEARRHVTKAIDLGPEGERVFLVLFVTGLRYAPDLYGESLKDKVGILIGGNPIPLISVSAQTSFVGLDQINVEIPRELEGRGTVNVSVTAEGFITSNLVDIEIGGLPGSSPPQVSGWEGDQALAGESMVINGSGFSPIPSGNTVRIAGLEADVMESTPTSLKVMIPFGVETGTVSVRTAMGEGLSRDPLRVRTSMSGIVENTAHQPLANVAVRIPSTSFAARTNNDGSFVLADAPVGPQTFVVDGDLLGVNPPYPKFTGKITVRASRDNRLGGAIALQQATGSSGTVGSSTSFTGGEGDDGGGNQYAKASQPQPQPQPQPVSIRTDGFSLEVQGSTKANFPTGATRGTIVLTPLKEGRTPVELPRGHYSSSIVQITPFNVKLDPGAKLIFPNKDELQVGTSLVLWRYDQDAGKFVQETAAATVSADGMRIETAADAIKVTSYYFAAVSSRTTTITGRVVERDGKTPVIRAQVRFRGQEASTDGNGGYQLRFVPVKDGEQIQVEVSVVRASGRVDRAKSQRVRAELNKRTIVPPVIMPGVADNRPPTILAPPKLEIEAGAPDGTDVPFVVTDPDPGQTFEVKVEGPPFVSVVRPPATSASISSYILRLRPSFSQAGEYKITLTATDNAPDNARKSAEHEIALSVKGVNRPPVASDQVVTVDEDNTLTIRLEATDPEGDRLTYTVVSQPAKGVLSGSAANPTYKPNLNVNGSDRFTFKVSDGANESNVATVAVIVRPVNDPPILTVPGQQASDEGQFINFAVSAADPDSGQKLAITATGLPEGATLTVATGTTSSQFRWTPTYAQAGTYTITFKVADDGAPSLSDATTMQISVADVPFFSAPNARTVNEGQALVFDITANDGLPSPVVITATDMPDGASFPGAATGSAQFRWTPSFTQAGNYTINFKGTFDAPLPVSETRQVRITVHDAQHNFAEDPASLTVYGAADALLPQPGTHTGSSVAIGDLNGDRIADLVMGSPSGAATPGGAVHIFFGRNTLAGTIDLARQQADVSIGGEAAGDLLGSSLAIGDINGDGKGDLIAGAPGADLAPNALDGGKVYAVFGNLAPGKYDIAKIAALTIRGAARNDRLGSSVAVGKINGNAGADDLIVGAPLCDIPGAASLLVDAGCVYAYWGGAALTGIKDLATSPADFAITGIVANGQFGAALTTGNFNGDTFAEIAAGAPNADLPGLKTAGVIYLVLGSESLRGTLNAMQASALVLNGSEAGDAAGTALAMADINGDGRADLIAGSPGADGPNNTRPGSGEVYVVFGSAAISARPSVLTIFGIGAGGDEFPDGFGSGVAAGDFTGDGIPDLLVGAPGADPVNATRPPAGAAYVIFGSRTHSPGAIDLTTRPADLRIFGAKSGDRLGSGGLAAGNINVSDPGDLAIGSPAAAKGIGTPGGAGEVRVLYGVKR